MEVSNGRRESSVLSRQGATPKTGSTQAGLFPQRRERERMTSDDFIYSLVKIHLMSRTAGRYNKFLNL